MAQYNAEPLERLINNFSRLNGVGRKGATRMAYQVLAMDEKDAAEFAAAIMDVHSKIKRCPVCRNFTDKDICPICSSPKRDDSVICIVENPRDVATFEKTREYRGLYHVLHGLISPMDGITAEQLTVKELLARLQDDKVKEVIMATSSTIEGETTAMYISRLVKPLGIKVTRLAYGLPVGASLEYADEVTLYRALEGRREI
ncbi:MAG: recombination protein RecR [Oscillospiraceae bacterium]|jgi:recombination protein RecR|nr:recombination protein RecR [Oscillospiraceae bacterium]